MHTSAPTSRDRTCTRPTSSGPTDRARNSVAPPQTSHFTSAGGQCLTNGSNAPESKRSVVDLVVINHVTVDGVMQAPGRADDDIGGGFRHGGWAVPGSDDVTYAATSKWM